MKEKYVFGELDQYLFGQGTHYDIYRETGRSCSDQEQKKRRIFCGVGA